MSLLSLFRRFFFNEAGRDKGLAKRFSTLVGIASRSAMPNMSSWNEKLPAIHH